MKQVLVVGYGNSLRSDDAVGLYAVREMQKVGTRSNVEFLEMHQLQPELAEIMSRKDLVIFIDAAMHGISGETRYEPVLPSSKTPEMSHSTNPESLLFMAKELYGHVPKAILVTVAGECFGIGTKLSAEVEVAMKGVAVRASQLIDEFLGAVVHA